MGTKAFDEGYKAGKENPKTAVNPYAKESHLYFEYRSGFDKARHEPNAAFQNGIKKAQTEIQNKLDRVGVKLENFGYDKLLEKSEKMAAQAKDGDVNIGGKRFSLKFNRSSGLYDVFDSNGREYEYTRLNTKSLSKAKQFLKDYLSN